MYCIYIYIGNPPNFMIYQVDKTAMLISDSFPEVKGSSGIDAEFDCKTLDPFPQCVRWTH